MTCFETLPPPRTIAYQGEPGAHSHDACQKIYARAETQPYPSFQETINAVRTGTAELGLLPVDNSIAGRVADVHHLLPSSGLTVTGEFFLPVEHHLLVIPGTRLKDLTHVHSHIHALGQCRKMIYEKGWKAVISVDTATAAREVAARETPQHGAIGSAAAAKLHALEILKRNIQDRPRNTTRFLLMRHARKSETLWSPMQGVTLTSFFFEVRSVAAALYKALGGFATNGVNLIKLESYLGGDGFEQASFFAEIEGHPHEPRVAAAFDELTHFSRQLKIMGVYPAADHRHESAAAP
ncbi:MAG: prephenate dehydratase [Pseudomonadota bacterium]